MTDIEYARMKSMRDLIIGFDCFATIASICRGVIDPLHSQHLDDPSWRSPKAIVIQGVSPLHVSLIDSALLSALSTVLFGDK